MLRKWVEYEPEPLLRDSLWSVWKTIEHSQSVFTNPSTVRQEDPRDHIPTSKDTRYPVHLPPASDRDKQRSQPQDGSAPCFSPLSHRNGLCPKVKSRGVRQQPGRHRGPTACGRVYRTVSEEVLGLGCLSVSGPARLPAPPRPPPRVSPGSSKVGATLPQGWSSVLRSDTSKSPRSGAPFRIIRDLRNL